jgi:hypothetical protein
VAASPGFPRQGLADDGPVGDILGSGRAVSTIAYWLQVVSCNRIRVKPTSRYRRSFQLRLIRDDSNLLLMTGIASPNCGQRNARNGPRLACCSGPPGVLRIGTCPFLGFPRYHIVTSAGWKELSTTGEQRHPRCREYYRQHQVRRQRHHGIASSDTPVELRQGPGKAILLLRTVIKESFIQFP